MRALPSRQETRTALENGLRRQPEILKKLKIPGLRPGQDRAIMNLHAQKDTLCFLPTGLGKSLVYIVPALAHDWKVVIFGPLISLMKDQYESLCREKLSAAMIHSGQHIAENTHNLMAWEQGDVQFLLVAPERLEQESFWKLMQAVPPSMVVIDECHCANQWADTFRPSYVKIGHFIEQIRPKVVLGLTATATEEAEEAIRRILNLENASLVCYYPKRENLIFKSSYYSDGHGLIEAIEREEGPTLVYCATRKNCDIAADLIKNSLPARSVSIYHAGLEPAEREIVQNRFMANEVNIVVATNAFGMGVNKPDIRAIVHRDIPGTVEAICQETGRAGRDGLNSLCTLLWEDRSQQVQEFFVEMAYPPTEMIQRVFHFLKKQANIETEIKLTIKSITEQMGENNERKVEACIRFLTFSGVLARTARGETPHRILIKKIHPDSKLGDLQNLILKYGCACADGYREILWETMQQITTMSQTRIRAKLKILDDGQYIAWQMPFRGSTTQVIGSLAQVNFTRFDERRNLAWQRLREVNQFYDTSDDQKHDFLTEYFGRPRQALKPLVDPEPAAV